MVKGWVKKKNPVFIPQIYLKDASVKWTSTVLSVQLHFGGFFMSSFKVLKFYHLAALTKIHLEIDCSFLFGYVIWQ